MSELPQEVIDFLYTEFQNQYQREGDISVAQAAEVWEITKTTARAKLKAMVKDGKLLELYGKLLNGTTGNFYRIPE